MSPNPKKKKAAEKKDYLKRVAELEAALREEKDKTETYLKQLKYARADLENLRKQMQRQIEEALDRRNRRLLMELLPIVEELDLAIEAARNNADTGILKGVEMVKKKMEKTLDNEGVSAIEVVGRTFDPHLHEAVLEVETIDYPDGTVIEELRKGYTYKDRVLRASMVKVARNPSSKKDEEEVKDE